MDMRDYIAQLIAVGVVLLIWIWSFTILRVVNAVAVALALTFFVTVLWIRVWGD